MAIYDTIIIGGGSTGFSAAMYAGRLNLETLVIAENIGGTLAIAGKIENWPGIKSIDGYDLVEQIKDHAKEYGIEIVEKKVISVEKKKNNFLVKVDGGQYESKTVIFATGTKVRKMGVPGEAEYANRGVHYCALCDGPLYKGKILGVVGGSDSAAKEALFLADYGSKVYVIYRGNKLRAEPINMEMVEQKIKSGKFEVLYDTNITEILGDGKKVNKIVLDKSYKQSKELDIGGLFVEIGHIPLSDLAKSLGVKLNDKNEIIIDREAKTNIPGIFAAGDVVDTPFKQAITGSAEGVLAAYSAYGYVSATNAKKK